MNRVSNRDDYCKLFTSLSYFINSLVRASLAGDAIAHRLALEFEAVGVVNQAIQDRVGIRGIPNLFVPSFLRDLGSDNRRTAAVPIVDNLNQVAAMSARRRDGASCPQHRPIERNLLQSGRTGVSSRNSLAVRQHVINRIITC